MTRRHEIMSALELSYIKTEIISDESMNDSMYTFHIENLPFHDEKEDACTQTYACTVRSMSEQEPPNLDIPHDESEEIDFTDVSFYEPSQFFCSSTTRRRTSHHYKDKTMKTVKMLKEKHRENERLRHHSLNQHLRLICRKVPGSAENGKETKVVMMQRIISYVAYLENTIRFMCTQLCVKANPTWLKLTSNVKDMEKSETWRKEFLSVRSEDSRDSEIFSRNVSRRLKLSSPITTPTTSNSTPEFKPPRSKMESYPDSQDDSADLSSSLGMDENTSNGWQWLIPAEEVVIDGSENFDGLLSNNEFDQIFELPSSTLESRLMKSPDEVKWLGSPDRSPVHSHEKSDGHYGIKCDVPYFEEQPYEISHTITVSPDQVIPQPAIKQEVMDDDDDDALTSAISSSTSLTKSQNSRHRQSSPKRTPLLNITNWSDIPLELSEELFDSKGWQCKQDLGSDALVSDGTEGYTSCRASDRAGAKATSGTDNVMAVYEQEAEHEKVLKDSHGEMSMKIDLRKSSWMNGFMMYSHLHRKQLTRENPGLHASAVSKIMGHRWRGMTSEQQHPYREQAQICAQELHRVLGKTCH